jgi:hypothetical protein
MRAWRREVGMLVGAPPAVPAVELTVEGDVVALRSVDAAAALSDGIARIPLGATPPALPLADGSVASLTLWLLGERGDPALRAALFAELARVCAPDGVLVAVDHNRPRRRSAALLALVVAPHPAGSSPASRWRRLAYPTARDAQAAGFTVERLRLAAGERVQVVWARRT